MSEELKPADQDAVERVAKAVQRAWDAGEDPVWNLPPIEFTPEEAAYLARAAIAAMRGE